MRIRQRLYLGYVAIGLIAVGAQLFTLNKLKTIAASFERGIPERIQSLSSASQVDDLSKLIRYYDEVLTQSARNYAFTKDRKWEERYKSFEPKLASAIEEAFKRGDEVDKRFFASVDKANLALVKMEYASIELVNSSKADEAVRILESSDYWSQKALYAKGLDDYVERRKAREGYALDTLMATMDSTTKQNQRLVEDCMQWVLVLIILVAAAAMTVPILISRTVPESSQQ